MQDIPKHVRAVKLFDGMDLNGFDTFLTKEGLNSDPDHVFKARYGSLRVIGPCAQVQTSAGSKCFGRQ
jgi:hypothetical protein